MKLSAHQKEALLLLNSGRLSNTIANKSIQALRRRGLVAPAGFHLESVIYKLTDAGKEVAAQQAG